MKIWLTGASGLLGTAVREAALKAGHDCVPLSRDGLLVPGAPLPLGHGDVLVHAAANTDVEACEREPAACWRDNVLLSEALARRVALVDARMAYISSTGVYGSAKATPWHEFDAADPATVHHRSKLLAESAVMRHCPDALIVRTGWLYGGRADNAKNFVARRIDEARAATGGRIGSNPRQRGNPSAATDVAERLLLLLAARHTGVFNTVARGHASRLEYVAEIVRLAGLPVAVEPVDPSHFKRLAPVSDNEMADNLRSRLLGLPEMPDWRDSLARYVATLPR